MGAEVDFDALARAAHESNGAMEKLSALFGAAFALEEWHFIARGTFPGVHPYVASNASYAENQPMVRAFTDSDRLLRFSMENNLTTKDGGALMLSISTVNIIDYLEKLMEHGVYGIWFNSDSRSEGFYLPLKQLRPVQEHLEKLKRSRLEDYGLSLSSDGEYDLNLHIHNDD